MTPQQKEPHHTMVLDLAREAGLPTYRFPKTEEEMERAEDVLARDLEKLSLDDQEAILFDTHGIATSTNAKEKDVAKVLQELDKEIDKINKKDAYEQALFMNPGYVRDEKFRLQFLRAVEYCPKMAAERVVNHFDTKRDLFGDGEVLAREVRQSDFSEEEMEQLRRGVEQMLPARDASGRAVLIINPSVSADSLSDLKDRMQIVGRSHFYMHTAALRDESIQNQGLVFVCYGMNCPLLGNFEAFEWINRVDLSVPISAIVSHICCDEDDPTVRPLIAGFRLFTERRDRHRMRFHYGSLNEVHFTLQTFGIPTELSAMEPGFVWSTDYHLQWLDAQRQWEERHDKEGSDEAELVIIPRRFDVLFGKSSRARLSTGTQRALHLVDMYQERYEQANKFEKTELAEKIITSIHESDGRFLKQDDKNNGVWMQVDHTDARKKVAHWFRHARSKMKQQSQKQQSDVDVQGIAGSGGRRTLDALATADVAESSPRPSKRVSIISACSQSSSDSDDS